MCGAQRRKHTHKCFRPCGECLILSLNCCAISKLRHASHLVSSRIRQTKVRKDSQAQARGVSAIETGQTESVPIVAIDKDTISSKPSGHVTGKKHRPALKDVCSQKLVEPSSQKRASRSNGQRRAIFQCQKQTSLQSKRVHDETQVKSRRSGS